jgi:hypothetical protein
MLINFLQPNLPLTIKSQIELWKTEMGRITQKDVVRWKIDDENIFIYLSNNHEHYKIIMNYFGL